uniref:Glucosylceramidase n=1 Tax=Timema bartmani TaxID=61472 RepID=A0A7R9F2Y2_9NEOP|nr:unnamed protein product [Timema bartmani]
MGILLLITFGSCFALAQNCVPRDYGQGSIVCVCNATYCDYVEPTTAEQLTGNVVRHYVSAKDGHRLEPMTMEFEDGAEQEGIATFHVSRDVTYQEIIGFGGADTDATGINLLSLSEDSQDNLLRFLDEYAAENLEFWGLTTQNEPGHGLTYGSWNSMGWTPEQLLEWVVGYFGPALEAGGYSHLKLMINDDQRINVPDFVKTYENTSLYHYASGMAVHWYFDSASADILTQAHDDYPDKFILYTEACITHGATEPAVTLGSWENGEKYLSDIIEVTNNWVTGWTDWNMALDLEGGPNWANNTVDAPIIVNATADEFYKQPMFYALAHVTKFVPPGSVRIGLETDSDNGVENVAFVTPDNVTVIILLNREDTVLQAVISDPDKGDCILLTSETMRQMDLHGWRNIEISKFVCENKTGQLNVGRHAECMWVGSVVNRDSTYQDVNGFGGAATDATGVNKRALSEDAGDKLISFLDAYAEQNVEFWGLTPQNEPSHGLEYGFFNSMGWYPSEMLEWIVGYLGPALDDAGYADLKMMINDNQRTMISKWAELYKNESLSKFVSGMAVHWYTDQDSDPKILTQLHDEYPEKFILYTEACLANAPVVLSQTTEDGEIEVQISVMNNWVTGWTDWNMALDLEGGPNWVSNFVDAPIIVNATADEFYKQPMFYALAHFSKFVPPGSVHIGLDSDDDTGIENIAFLTPDNVTVVILQNSKLTVACARRHLCGFGAAGYTAQALNTSTGAGHDNLWRHCRYLSDRLLCPVDSAKESLDTCSQKIDRATTFRTKAGDAPGR